MLCDTLPLKMIKHTYIYHRTADGHPTQVRQFCLQRDMRQFVMYRAVVGCTDPIDLIFYRERASQPAKNETKEKWKELENVNQASKHCLFTHCYQGLTYGLGQSLARTYPPPPLYPHTPLARTGGLQGLRLKRRMASI